MARVIRSYIATGYVAIPSHWHKFYLCLATKTFFFTVLGFLLGDP